MQKHTHIAILAIIIVIMFLPIGIPMAFKQILILFSALGIITLSLFAYREYKALLARIGKEQKSPSPSFVDNTIAMQERGK